MTNRQYMSSRIWKYLLDINNCDQILYHDDFSVYLDGFNLCGIYTDHQSLPFAK